MTYPVSMNDLTRRIARILALAFLGTLLVTACTLAFGQTMTDREWQDSFTGMLGNEMDAIRIDCVEEFGEAASDFSCLETDMSLDLAKLSVEVGLGSFRDVFAVNAWSRLDNNGLSRLYAVDDGDGGTHGYTIGILLDDYDDYNSFVLVGYIGHYDENGDLID